jgi:DNA polymerase-3 subunit gamma/tau
VLSRVQRFEFRPIAPEALATTLERILIEEKIPYDAAALPAVVRAAEGSLRDALSLLDTAIAYGNGRLEAETTAGLLGTTAPAEVRAFATALIAHETAAALEAIDRACRDGEDLHAFTRDVVELLRRALVLKAAPTTKLADVTHVEGNELRKLGEGVNLDELLYILRAFLDADAAMRESPHPRVELEMATVRATRRPVPKALDEILQRVDEAAQRLRQAGATAAPPPRAQETLPGAEVSGPRASVTAAPRVPAPAARPAPTVAESTARAAAGDVTAAWQAVIEEVMRRRPTLGAVLAQSKPGALRDGELTIVLSGNHFHREMLADGASRDVVLQALRRSIPGVERFRVSAEDEGGGGVAGHPAVQAAVAEFQGEVVAVRPRSPEGEGQ